MMADKKEVFTINDDFKIACVPYLILLCTIQDELAAFPLAVDDGTGSIRCTWWKEYDQQQPTVVEPQVSLNNSNRVTVHGQVRKHGTGSLISSMSIISPCISVCMCTCMSAYVRLCVCLLMHAGM